MIIKPANRQTLPKLIFWFLFLVMFVPIVFAEYYFYNNAGTSAPTSYYYYNNAGTPPPTPTGGQISEKPEADDFVVATPPAVPLWKKQNEFYAGDSVSLTASWSPNGWSDQDRLWYHPDSGPDVDNGLHDDEDKLGFWWDDGGAAGSFADQASATPEYTVGAPAAGSSEEVTIQLWIRDNTDTTNSPPFWDDVDIEVEDETAVIVVFDPDADHVQLDMDMDNIDGLNADAGEGDFDPNEANCGKAARHAYASTFIANPPVADCPWGETGTAHVLYNSSTGVPTDDPEEIDYGQVEKGDCVRYTGYVNHVETCITDETGATWGANTADSDEDHNFAESSIENFIAARPTGYFIIVTIYKHPDN